MSDGTIEALKWLALVLMVCDHVDKYLFSGTIDWLFLAGRLCLPIFVFVLVLNLSRVEAYISGAHIRTMKRLAIFGALASVPFVALGGLADGWWPLNVMFTLLVIVGTRYVFEVAGLIPAAVVFMLGGAMVEFWWPAVALGLAAWSYQKQPTVGAAVVVVLSLAALGYVNGNQWALLALPLLFLASKIDLRVPRVRWAFYAFYPLHLAALWLIRIPMSEAGYLFF